MFGGGGRKGSEVMSVSSGTWQKKGATEGRLGGSELSSSKLPAYRTHKEYITIDCLLASFHILHSCLFFGL